MHKLAAPDWDACDDYEEIVNRSMIPTVAIRKKFRPQVRQQYQNYHARAPNLESMQSNVPSKGMDHLNSAYRHDHMMAVKARILANQSALSATHCQLCGSGNLIKTWDHYLPRAAFPELSACAYNIVPSCYDCNTTKLANWYTGTSRSILHLYYDDIPTDLPYLGAEIEFVKGKPIASFEPCMPEGGDSAFFEAYSRHFKTLDLKHRFEDDACRELPRIQGKISEYWELELEESEIVGKLRTAADRELAGPTSFLAALLRAAADSPSFLAYTKGVP